MIKKPYLIAEIGINHNGDLKVAKQLIDNAFEASFDAVKFQKEILKAFIQKNYQIHQEKVHGATLKDIKKQGWNLKKKNMTRQINTVKIRKWNGLHRHGI